MKLKIMIYDNEKVVFMIINEDELDSIYSKYTNSFISIVSIIY